MAKPAKKTAIDPATDLFGDIPVSLRDVELWLYLVPKLPHYHRARSSYARNWNVIDKIKHEKANGTLADIFGNELCNFCGQTLAADAPTAPPTDPASEIAAMRRRILALETLIRPIKNPRLAGLI